MNNIRYLKLALFGYVHGKTARGGQTRSRQTDCSLDYICICRVRTRSREMAYARHVVATAISQVSKSFSQARVEVKLLHTMVSKAHKDMPEYLVFKFYLYKAQKLQNAQIGNFKPKCWNMKVHVYQNIVNLSN